MDCLEGECVAYLLPMGCPGIYSICYSQLEGSKDSFPLDGIFPTFIDIGFNKGYGNSSLLRIILLPYW